MNLQSWLFFLDGIERLSGHVQNGLINIEQLRPYLQYWINDIHATEKDENDAAWSAALLTYIAFYRFNGVQRLFRAFGRNIDPTGSSFLIFLQKMRDQPLAERLASTVGLEYLGPRRTR